MKPNPTVFEVETDEEDDDEAEGVEDTVIADATQFDAAVFCAVLPYPVRHC